MELVKHETCQEYVARRLSEGWSIVWHKGYHLILSSPDGNTLRPVDLRNDIETLRPNAAGDEESITLGSSGAGNHWQDVDEVTPDEDTTRVFTKSSSYLRDLYELPAHSGSGTINSIKIYIRCYKGVGSCYAKPSLKSDSTVTDGTEIALTTDWTTYSEQWNTNPADSGAWEWADIDALQIGVSLKGDGTIYSLCTQVYVEVDYSPLVEKESSDTGSGADAYVSLETGEIKTSSDAGSGAEGTPMQSATLFGGETGSGIEAFVARLLAAFDTGTGAEVSGLLKDLFASELGQGSDSFVAKIETPTKGGGMKLWI